MSIINVGRKSLPAAVLPIVAGLAAAGLVMAAPAQAASRAPARAASAGLHVAGKVDLGRLGTSFSYVLTEAPDGNVYYSRGSVVYVVKGDHAPATALRASGPVLAVTASSSDLLVDVGNKVSAYALSDDRWLGTWTLPSSLRVTSAGLFVVGTTVWAFTDWATDQSGFEFANVDRFSLSSSAVHSNDIAGTGIGLLLLGGQKVRLLNPGNGHPSATISVPGAVFLVPGPSAAVVTVSHGTTYLLRLAR